MRYLNWEAVRHALEQDTPTYMLGWLPNAASKEVAARQEAWVVPNEEYEVMLPEDANDTEDDFVFGWQHFGPSAEVHTMGVPGGALVMMQHPALLTYFWRTVRRDAASINDWLLAIPRMRHRLMRMTFAQALDMASDWHRDEAKRRRALVGKEAFCSAPIGEGERFKTPSGRYWVRLTTVEAYQQESARMDHCVGWSKTYADQYLSADGEPPMGIWSLREDGGKRSLLTAEIALLKVDGDNLVFDPVQIRAAHNFQPPHCYWDDVHALRNFTGEATDALSRMRHELSKRRAA